MRRVAMGCEDGDGVAEILEADGGVDDKAFGATDAEIWMKEHDVLLFLRHRVRSYNRLIEGLIWESFTFFGEALPSCHVPLAILNCTTAELRIGHISLDTLILTVHEVTLLSTRNIVDLCLI